MLPYPLSVNHGLYISKCFSILIELQNDSYDVFHGHLNVKVNVKCQTLIIGPRQANLVLTAYASSEGSGEPAHPRSLARTSAARSYKQ